MPDKYIIYREDHKHNGAAEWRRQVGELSPTQKKDFLGIVHMNRFCDGSELSKYPAVNAILAHYRKGKAQLRADQ